MKLLITLKNKYSQNRNCSQKQLLANIINWLESYVIEITNLLNMFSKLNNIIPDLYNLIEMNIFNYKKEFIGYKDNSKGDDIVNKVFFLGMESILKVVTSNISIYTNPENFENHLTQLQNTNKEIIQYALQLNTVFCLKSKEVYTLQEITDLIDAFIMNNMGKIDNIS